jgi:hypothetical protein
MQKKPILSITNFSGAGKGGLFFNNGLTAHSEGSSSMLIEDFKQENVFSKTDTGFTNVEYIRAMEYLTLLDGVDGADEYMLMLDSAGYFYIKGYNTSITDGEILDVYALFSNYPDIKALPSGNLLVTTYTTGGVDYASLMIRGFCTSDSSTTQIVDGDGRDLNVLGATVGTKITNITTGETYTIASITTTNSTDDTLTFTTGVACSEGDEFMTLSVNAFNLSSGMTVPTFKGQPTTSAWKRQIVQFDDYHFILNGNYLALLDTDEATFDNMFKQLPYTHQALSIAVNGIKVAITTETPTGEGYLLYWDGYSDGWLNIKKLGGVVKSVKSYKDGFIYISNGRLYYTDGYNDILMSAYADTNDMASSLANLNAYNFNSLVISNEMVFIASDQDNHNRVFPGIYYWNKEYGWGYMPSLNGTNQCWGSPKSGAAAEVISEILYKNDNYKRIDIGYKNGLNAITDSGEYTGTPLSKSFTFYLSLPADQQIKSIGLNIGVNPKYYSITGSDTQCKVGLNIGDGRTGLTKYFNNVNITSTTTIANINGATQPGVVNKEVLVTGTNSSTTGITSGGERTFITSIANAGTGSEVWTVSPALSSTVSNCTMVQYMVDNVDIKTIAIDDIRNEQMYYTEKEVLGDKLIIEIVIYGIANAFPVAIQGINIYA